MINLPFSGRVGKALIEKVAEATGVIYEPTRIRRRAKAQADAAMIEAKSRIAVSSLEHRALQREARNQANADQILQGAFGYIEPAADPSHIDNDWMSHFFDRAKVISDGDMQDLLSRILAGEANQSGRFSRRTVATTCTLSKDDTEEFVKLRSFCWPGCQVWLTPVITDWQESVYASRGLRFGTLIHLESIGLIKYVTLGEYCLDLSERSTISYFGRRIQISVKDGKFPAGLSTFTETGEQLAHVCIVPPIDAFFDWYVRLLERRGHEPEVLG